MILLLLLLLLQYGQARDPGSFLRVENLRQTDSVQSGACSQDFLIYCQVAILKTSQFGQKMKDASELAIQLFDDFETFKEIILLISKETVNAILSRPILIQFFLLNVRFVKLSISYTI